MSATAFTQSISEFESYLQTFKEIEKWVETELSHNRCSLDLLNLRSVVKTAEMILKDIIDAAEQTTKGELTENKHLYEQ